MVLKFDQIKKKTYIALLFIKGSSGLLMSFFELRYFFFQPEIALIRAEFSENFSN